MARQSGFRKVPWRRAGWGFALALGLAAVTPVGLAAESPDQAELKRKQGEVERLQRELDKARTDLKRAEEENRRLRERQTRPAPTGTAGAPARPAPAPVTPLAQVPPLAADTVVPAPELAAHFATDPAAASTRYEGQTFRVRGEVLRLDTEFVVRNFHVILAGSDARTEVVAKFNYVDKYTSVYTKDRGRALVARMGGKEEYPLFELGQTVVIQGRCAGFKKGAVTLHRCEVIPGSP